MKNKKQDDSLFKNSGIIIYPSLHFVVRGTEIHSGHEYENEENSNKFKFGVKNIDEILPQNLKQPLVIMIEGPSGTFKSILAQNFLLYGLLNDKNALHIRLHDRTKFIPRQILLNPEIYEYLNKRISKNDLKYKNINNHNREKLYSEFWNKIEQYDESYNTPKFKMQPWVYDKSGQATKLIEIAFKSGSLFPEEFVQIIRDIHLKYKISRVVLNDIGLIGVSYPFLKSSRTASTLFLTAFVHIMRNYNIDLVMLGTKGQFKESDEVVDRATTLADAVLKCNFYDIFGARYMAISGQSLFVGMKAGNNVRDNENKKSDAEEIFSYKEFVPGVILPKGSNVFDIDLEHLKGLVGFDTGNIHRPGLSLYIFEEGILQLQYNSEIKQLIQSAFGLPDENNISESKGPNVNIVRFDSMMSEAVHDSFGVLGNSPIDRTVLKTIDEFMVNNDSFIHLREFEKKRDKYFVKLSDGEVRCAPYFANVLLLAFRKDITSDIKRKKIEKLLGQHDNDNGFRPRNWASVRDAAGKIYQQLKNKTDHPVEYFFDYDSFAQETLSCSLIDVLITKTESRESLDKMCEIESNDDTEKRKIITSNGNKIFKMLKNSNLKIKKDDDVYMFQELLLRSPKVLQELVYKINEDIRMPMTLNPNAGIYLCWYSQLRHLIYRYPFLAEKLDICALPGGGFRGDWYLGIVKGSVSVNLGSRVINILCDEKEEYKRFSKGVGLPTMKKFYKTGSTNPQYFAWPRANKDVSMNKVLEIHNQAHLRSSIHDDKSSPKYDCKYLKIRTALAKVCGQLAQSGKELTYSNIANKSISNRDKIDRLQEIVGRIPNQINNLA